MAQVCFAKPTSRLALAILMLLFALATAGVQPFARAGAGLAWADTPLPVEAYARLPAVSSPSVSPDGNRIAFVSDRAGAPVIIVVPSGRSPGIQGISAELGEDVVVLDLIWSDPTTLLIAIEHFFDFNPYSGKASTVSDYALQMLISVDLKTGKPKRIDSAIDGVVTVEATEILGQYGKKLGSVLVPMYGLAAQLPSEVRRGIRPESLLHVFALDPKTENRRRVEVGTEHTFDWIPDGKGGLAARVERDERTGERWIETRGTANKGDWKRIFTFSEQFSGFVAGVMANQKDLLLVGPHKGREALFLLSMDGGQPRLAVGDPKQDLGRVMRDPQTGAPVGVFKSIDASTSDSQSWLDPDLKDAYDFARAVLKDVPVVKVVAWSNDRKVVVVHESGNGKPSAYSVIDLVARNRVLLGSTFPEVAEKPLAQADWYNYTARDGTAIQAVLIRPAGAAPDAKLPTIILPHGGPASQDTTEFDSLAQFFASRGYQVVQPNFRGSTGYGGAFERAGWGQWGRLMQDDVTDALKAVIDDGKADPNRVCIVGWSYGGYAAMAGATMTPELYRCAIAINGVYDLREFLMERGRRFGRTSATSDYWEVSIGRDLGKEELDARSPTKLADVVRAPVLLIFGENDVVVDAGQSQMMFDALRGRGKAVDRLKLKKADHSFNQPGTRAEAFAAMERFLAQHNPVN